MRLRLGYGLIKYLQMVIHTLAGPWTLVSAMGFLGWVARLHVGWQKSGPGPEETRAAAVLRAEKRILNNIALEKMHQQS